MALKDKGDYIVEYLAQLRFLITKKQTRRGAINNSNKELALFR